MLKSVVITSRNNSNLCLPTLIFFVSEYKTCRSLGKKERVSKHKLSKGCHQGQNIIFLAVLQRLEFKNFSYRPTMVADNTFQCSMAPPFWNPFCRPWFWKHAAKFTGEHPCWSEISIKLLCNFIEIILRHQCSPVNLLHTFRACFYKNTSGGLLLGLATV